MKSLLVLLLLLVIFRIGYATSDHIRVSECDHTCSAGENTANAQLKECCQLWLRYDDSRNSSSSMCYSGAAHCWLIDK